MNEEDWLTCNDPKRMLEYHKDKASDRKSRLFAVACCRHILHVTDDVRIEEALDVAERVADGEVSLTGGIHEAVQKKAFDALNDAEIGSPTRRAAKAAIHANLHVWLPSVALTVAEEARDAKLAADRVRRRVEACYQARTFRDIFGNPFRPVTLDPEWLTSTVVQLAQGIYDERAFDRLPILADALQDAGCDNDDVLMHCRGPGPHVRGCWVVDLVLGKS